MYPLKRIKVLLTLFVRHINETKGEEGLNLDLYIVLKATLQETSTVTEC